MSRVSRIACGLLIMGLFACNSAKVISSWKSEEAGQVKFNKVLVIGMMGAKDQDIRQNVENAFAQQLETNGINAVSAYRQYGPKTFRNMQEQDVVKMVNDDGFDGVMVVELVDKNKEKNYTPGYVNYTPYGVIRGRWWPHYTVLYDRIYSPGYYTTSTNYTLEINLYDSRNNKLEYSAQSRAFDPGSAQALAADVSKTVMADMVNQGIIRK